MTFGTTKASERKQFQNQLKRYRKLTLDLTENSTWIRICIEKKPDITIIPCETLKNMYYHTIYNDHICSCGSSITYFDLPFEERIEACRIHNEHWH